jgi:hypothetical protein
MCAPTTPPPVFLAASLQATIAWVAVLAVLAVLAAFRVIRGYRSLPQQGRRKVVFILDGLTYGVPILGIVILFLVYIPWGDALQAWYNSQLEQLVVVRGCSTAMLDTAFASARQCEQILFFLGVAALVSVVPLSIARSFFSQR